MQVHGIKLCLKLISLFLTFNKEAISKKASDFDYLCFYNLEDCELAVHSAAQYNTVELLEFLINESATMKNPYLMTLFHYTLSDTTNTTDIIEAKINFLLTRYPILVGMRDIHQ